MYHFASMLSIWLSTIIEFTITYHAAPLRLNVKNVINFPFQFKWLILLFQGRSLHSDRIFWHQHEGCRKIFIAVCNIICVKNNSICFFLPHSQNSQSLSTAGVIINSPHSTFNFILFCWFSFAGQGGKEFGTVGPISYGGTLAREGMELRGWRGIFHCYGGIWTHFQEQDNLKSNSSTLDIYHAKYATNLVWFMPTKDTNRKKMVKQYYHF